MVEPANGSHVAVPVRRTGGRLGVVLAVVTTHVLNGWLLQGETSVEIAVPPEVVYGLVSDVTRTGEWSPECVRCRWEPGSSGRPGDLFRGWNQNGRNRWSRLCEVLEATPADVFAFRTVATKFKPDSTTWRYSLQPTATGTRLTESFHITKPLPRPMAWLAERMMPGHTDVRPEMQSSLAMIKGILE
ncbi:SRPBCC family protein [Kribbella sp. NBC_01505]|uniref:SRPBCC family protein n=1 Tax=Kribbella sp. NBC_01505 TaxID=2903580 RepID=UPI0038665C2A